MPFTICTAQNGKEHTTAEDWVPRWTQVNRDLSLADTIAVLKTWISYPVSIQVSLNGQIIPEAEWRTWLDNPPTFKLGPMEPVSANDNIMSVDYYHMAQVIRFNPQDELKQRLIYVMYDTSNPAYVILFDQTTGERTKVVLPCMSADGFGDRRRFFGILSEK